MDTCCCHSSRPHYYFWAFAAVATAAYSLPIRASRQHCRHGNIVDTLICRHLLLLPHSSRPSSHSLKAAVRAWLCWAPHERLLVILIGDVLNNTDHCNLLMYLWTFAAVAMQLTAFQSEPEGSSAGSGLLGSPIGSADLAGMDDSLQEAIAASRAGEICMTVKSQITPCPYLSHPCQLEEHGQC